MYRKSITILLILLILLSTIDFGCSSDNSESPPTASVTPTSDIENSPTPSQTYELPPSSFMPEIPRISVHELKAKIDAGVNIAIIDSRDQKYYKGVHIINSISIPYDEMDKPYRDLGQYEEITTYCT